jgi:hypothetical protein
MHKSDKTALGVWMTIRNIFVSDQNHQAAARSRNFMRCSMAMRSSLDVMGTEVRGIHGGLATVAICKEDTIRGNLRVGFYCSQELINLRERDCKTNHVYVSITYMHRGRIYFLIVVHKRGG